jgi:hypothetical protein
MPTKLMRAVLLCTMALALSGCLFSRASVFDLRTGVTDLPTGRFELRSGDRPPGHKTATVEVTRHGNLYVYRDESAGTDAAVLSFHAIGDKFYLVVAIPAGKPIYYGVVDARSPDKLPFVLMDCDPKAPDDLVAQPAAKGVERCNATNRERVIAIADRFKADMLANRIEASRLFEYTRIR